jgi:hypothetical protein
MVRGYRFPLLVGLLLLWIAVVAVWITLDPRHGTGS